ncbi:MAG: ABC transporter permease [Armatimonadota bacterium]|nr:ABC transporter permease [Armatimonadota bacterium]
MIARRVARFLGLAAVVAVLNFLAPRVLPGSPVFGGAGADAAMLPVQAREALLATYFAEAPLHVQFGRYLIGVLRGDLGWSLTSHRPVTRILFERLPWTVFLVGGAVVASAGLGAWLGWLSASSPGRRRVRLLSAAAVGAGALPEFLLAMIAIVFLAARWRLFPSSGGITPFVAHAGLMAALLDLAWHAALPGLVLVIGLVPAFTLLVRNALLPVLGERYMLTAQAKGLAPRRVAWHALRSALPPVATLFGLRFGAALAGAAVVERVFAYPGIGWLLYEAVATRDYPVLQGVVFVSSLGLLAVIFALDLIAGWLDPRVVDAR